MNLLVLTFIIFRIGITVGYWKLFEKANVEGWKSLIPFYSEYVVITLVGKSRWWLVYLLIPAVNVFVFFVLLIDLVKCYGQDSFLSQMLIVFVSFIYLPYLGFKPDVRYLGKLDEIPEVEKSKFHEWIEAVAFAVVAATLIRWLIMEAYTIPTPCMENTLLVGDFLFVSKFHYGTRTTTTPLQVPLTHQKIWFTDLPSYTEAVKLPQYRLPGLTEVKRNDVVVFNIPPRALNDKDYPVDLKTNYIKRCVAIAGDTLSIENNQVMVDGRPSENPELMQLSYLMYANGPINERNFRKLGLDSEDYRIEGRSEGGVIYKVFLTGEKAAEIRNLRLPYIQSLELDTRDDQPDIIPYSLYYGNTVVEPHLFNWTRDNFGPLWLPEEGATIPVNDTTLTLYGYTIVEYDHNENARIENGKLIIDGKEVTEYTFKQNYYFMMGDNRHNSLDSRYWGFVPEDHIVGKAFFIWLSIDNDASFMNKIRWKRFFNLIR